MHNYFRKMLGWQQIGRRHFPITVVIVVGQLYPTALRYGAAAVPTEYYH